MKSKSMASAAITFVILASQLVHAQETFLTSIMIYRVKVTDDIAEPAKQVQEILAEPVGVVFENIHLTDLLEVLSDNYDIEIEVEDGIIRPFKEAADTQSNDETSYVTDGMIDYINLKGVTLEQALSAFLRPLSVDFGILSDRIYISTPAKLNAEVASVKTNNTPRNLEIEMNRTELQFGFTSLKLDGSDLVWSGTPVADNDDIVLVSMPSVINTSGANSTIAIKTEQPVEYFEEIGADNEQSLESYAASLGRKHPLNQALGIEYRDKRTRRILDALIKRSYIVKQVHIDAPIKGNSTINLKYIPIWKGIDRLLRSIGFEMVAIDDELHVRPVVDKNPDRAREFVHKTRNDETGLEISIVTTARGSEHVILNINATLLSLGGNGLIPGTDLPGGPPSVTVSLVSTTLKAKLGHWVYMLPPRNGPENILMLFKAERHNS